MITDSLSLAIPARADARADSSPLPSRADLVRRCCRLMDEHLRQPLVLDELCHALRTKPRTLEYAFQHVLGMSPMANYRARRFAAARSMLVAARRRPTSVTEVATLYSFWHLGRFSVEYRSRFGESPSTTLRRTRESA